MTIRRRCGRRRGKRPPAYTWPECVVSRAQGTFVPPAIVLVGILMGAADGLKFMALGLPPTDDEAESIHPGLLRWRDLFCPLFVDRYDWRLAAFIVPKPRDAERSACGERMHTPYGLQCWAGSGL